MARTNNAKNVSDPDTGRAIEALVRSVGGDPGAFDGRLISELVETCLKIISDGHDTGQLKLGAG